MHTVSLISAVAALLAVGTLSVPTETHDLASRAAPVKLTAYIDEKNLGQQTKQYCVLLPAVKGENVGDAPYNGGVQAFCTKGALTDTKNQKPLPSNFLPIDVYGEERGKNGRYSRFVAGCFNATSVGLNPNDEGGQYASVGGPNGKGYPENSVCKK
ncbi:hypothetical protein RhiJN_25899 [Ceratobasidium sp. AG-Ba]|nr:hypothetical protein RhiJN_25899 [Ceratobasidium sp. AG-Ba]